MRNQNRALVSAAATAVVAAMTGANLSAAELYWKGGVGNLPDPNYTTNGSDTVAYTPGDIVNLGAGGTVTVNSAINYSATTPNAPGSVRVGHNFGTLPGSASLTVAGSGSSLVLLGDAAATNLFDRAALVVGYNADGSYVSTTTSHMDGLAIIGGDNPDDAITGTGTGTLTVNGGNFRVRRSDFIIGYGNRGVLNHGAGNLMVGMHNQAGVSDAAYDMYLGYTTASEWNKDFRGTHFIGNSLFIGSGSVFNLQAGRVFTKHKSIANGYATNAPEGDVVVGRNGSDNDRLNISYNGTPTSGGDIGPTELRVNNRFLLASGGVGATTSTVNQSAGTVIVARNLSVSDTGNTSTATYNLSGGTLTANADLSRVGRRGDGKMVQTGGTATFNAGLAVGDDDTAAAGEVDNATGLYQISAGTLNANLVGGDALRIGSAGNGTFRVVGDDGTVSVNGNMLVGKTEDGVGTLAYRFEAGDSLSQVGVTGTATLALGTGVEFDASAAAPGASSYDLLTAADIVDNGTSVTAPGWTLAIVPGGAGEILRATQTANLYWDTNGAAAGSGGAAPSGTWDGSASNFSPDSAGTSGSTTAATTATDDVSFAAGSDATGAYAVTVAGTRTANAVLVKSGQVSFTGGTIAARIFDVSSGASATVASNVSTTVGLRKTNAGTLTLTSANTYTGGTTVSGGTLVMANANAINAGQALTVNAGATARVQTGVSTAIDVSGLLIAPTGKLDLNDGALVKRNASGGAAQTAVRQVTAALKTGLENGGNFDWLGNGISSTEANADNATAGSVLFGLGVIQNNLAAAGAPDGTTADETPGGTIYTTFKGRTVGLNDTLVRYTYMGDADLSGNIDGTDYSLIDAGFGAGLSGWINGDFDYSGSIDGTDYALIDNAFGAQTGVLPELVQARIAEHTALFGQSYVDALAAVQSGVVPEPATLGVLALAGVGLVARRRRRA